MVADQFPPPLSSVGPSQPPVLVFARFVDQTKELAQVKLLDLLVTLQLSDPSKCKRFSLQHAHTRTHRQRVELLFPRKLEKGQRLGGSCDDEGFGSASWRRKEILKLLCGY